MKYQKIFIALIFLVLLALVVSGCSLFLPPGDTAEGLHIIIGTQEEFARTISPDFTDLFFSQYDITIEGGGNIININSISPVVTLDDSQTLALYPNSLPTNVKFTITVKAYRTGETGENYSAYGSSDFNLAPGTTIVKVDIGPIIKDGAKGTLNYIINGSGAAILLPYVDFIPDPEPLLDPDSDLTPVAGTDPWGNPEAIILTVDNSNHNLSLPSGYYMFYYKNSAENTNINVIHIYKNFTTRFIINL
ncbi:MAG: hypothetical protein FWD78_05820 [Treponema sp.]|nr:hypothetical protein [Treponema sp.]